MKINKITINYKRKAHLFRALSAISVFLPVAIYIFLAFYNNEIAITKKLTLGITLTISIILFISNILFKYKLRSPVWICLIGIYICLEKIETLLIIMAICTILDEFIFTPLARKYKNLYTINVQIDRRG